MTHGSLFSGIGGFDLAAEWMGWGNRFHCEWNPFGQKVLKHHFPNSDSYSDITKTDFTKYEGQIDIITGGFPCQPYSTAGLRKGKADERHLFPEMLRVIEEVKPRWVIGENVRGLVSWGGNWYSRRCMLTWKVKVMKSKRLLFQLQASTPRTKEKEFGLLPTPRTADVEGGLVKNVQQENGNYFRTNKDGVRWGVKLRDVIENGLLQTPRASDKNKHWKTENWKGDDLESQMNEIHGTRSHLNPHFVEEMMGFPHNWTASPFLSGETSQLKPMETQ